MLQRRPHPRIVVGLLFAGLVAAGVAASAAAEHESARAAFESCLGCPGCEAGDCDGDSAPAHDHCCASTCWGHMAWLLRAPGSVAEPQPNRSRLIALAVHDPEQWPSPVFHPPRS